jgi:hypothetical protein
MTSFATRAAMLVKDWNPEGDGELGAIVCAPA